MTDMNATTSIIKSNVNGLKTSITRQNITPCPPRPNVTTSMIA